MFCPKCGSLLLPKSDGKKKILACSSCNYKSKTEKLVLKESAGKKEKVEIVNDISMKHLPLVDEECPTCGHKKARYWTVQTRAGDEPETKFMKCEKCGHTWRDYD